MAPILGQTIINKRVNLHIYPLHVSLAQRYYRDHRTVGATGVYTHFIY